MEKLKYEIPFKTRVVKGTLPKTLNNESISRHKSMRMLYGNGSSTRLNLNPIDHSFFYYMLHVSTLKKPALKYIIIFIYYFRSKIHTVVCFPCMCLSGTCIWNCNSANKILANCALHNAKRRAKPYLLWLLSLVIIISRLPLKLCGLRLCNSNAGYVDIL